MALPELNLSTTLADRTAEVIRRRILKLEPGYQPGDRLYPSKLAEDLGVSMTPIREALKLLVAQGIVTSSPRRGMTVVRLSTADLDDLVSVRGGLEALALRLGGCCFSQEELDKLEECLDKCEQAIDDGDIETCGLKDAEFHRRLLAGGRSPRLISLYETLLNQAQIIEAYNPRYPDLVRESLAEHRRLMEEIRSGDVKRAEKALWEHWGATRRRVRLKYEQFAQPDRPSATVIDSWSSRDFVDT